TRSLRAEVQLSVPQVGLRAEASATGSIRLKKARALVIPDSAILYGSSGPYVFVADIDRGRLLPRKIRTGLRNSTSVEVIYGLTEGDALSAGPNFLIDSESRINASHD